MTIKELGKLANNNKMTVERYLDYLRMVEQDAIEYFCECVSTKYCLHRYMDSLTREEAKGLGWEEDDIKEVYDNPNEDFY